MEIRQGVSKEDFQNYNTDRIRKDFLIDNCFEEGRISLLYSHIDRIIVGGLIATEKGMELVAPPKIRSHYFLDRREMGIINLGGLGYVDVDGKRYSLGKYDCLYLGRGTREIRFFSADDGDAAYFYFNSCPAHKEYPNALCSKEDSVKAHLGSKSECNERTIYKYILPGNVESCQLVMGLTMLKDGSVWNTMPSHTHECRMEVYLYFDIKDNNAVFHFMGEPSQTKHIIVNNMQAVISPSFSIHSGVGTSNYSFIWGMCGENQDFDDMQPAPIEQMR